MRAMVDTTRLLCCVKFARRKRLAEVCYSESSTSLSPALQQGSRSVEYRKGAVEQVRSYSRWLRDARNDLLNTTQRTRGDIKTGTG